METEISAELKEELRFIEKETRLLSQSPQNLRAFSIMLWCVFAAVLIVVFLAIKMETICLCFSSWLLAAS